MKTSNLTQERQNLTRKTWSELRVKNLEILNDYYDENIHFLDPLSNLKGLANLRAYYQHLYKNVIDIEFVFDDELANEEKQFFTWTMQLQAKGLNKGRPIEVKGCSHIIFSPESGKVIYHRDYFDVGEFIYEQLPVLRWIHRQVKKQMHP